VLGYESFLAIIITPYLDFLVLTDAFSGLKYCPTLLETVGLRVPNQNFRDFSVCSVDFKSRNFHPLDALWRQMPSAVLLTYSMDVRSRLI
jgi:hypothetical protein